MNTNFIFFFNSGPSLGLTVSWLSDVYVKGIARRSIPLEDRAAVLG